MTTTLRTLALLALALLPACNSGSGGASPRTVPAFDLSGRWTGTWTLPPTMMFPSGESGSIVADVIHNPDDTIGMTVKLGNSACFRAPVVMAGDVEWPVLSALATDGTLEISVTVQAAGNLAGSWIARRGPCAGQTGVAVLTR